MEDLLLLTGAAAAALLTVCDADLRTIHVMPGHRQEGTLIIASANKDLDSAPLADVELTMSCVRCHQYLTRRRLAR